MKWISALFILSSCERDCYGFNAKIAYNCLDICNVNIIAHAVEKSCYTNCIQSMNECKKNLMVK